LSPHLIDTENPTQYRPHSGRDDSYRFLHTFFFVSHWLKHSISLLPTCQIHSSRHSQVGGKSRLLVERPFLSVQRQLRFISGIMPEEDVDTILIQLKQIALPQQQEVETLHQVEQWRDKLIAGDNALINNLLQQFGNADRQHLRQLVRNANKEAQGNKPPKASRLLFKYLKELYDETS